MNSNFKPLGLAVAVAAVSAGYAGIAGAQGVERSIGNLGDTAIVPYYTVQDDWVTGIHIINTAESTQVIKLRLRRATDSADALDFNIVLSPKDEWTGSISDETGNIVVSTDDKSCTAPLEPYYSAGAYPMQPIYRLGAEEGYIEVISMGQPDVVEAASALAYAAKHVDGVPRDCSAVASNFFANTNLSFATGAPVVSTIAANKGNISNSQTHQTANAATAAITFAAGKACVSATGIILDGTGATDAAAAKVCQNDFVSTDNGLKVSYFFRDAASGIEFGGDAVHLSNFSDEAWMTNQETGLFSGDPYGFDYPDLNGGPWQGFDVGASRTYFAGLRSAAVLGVSSVVNDWSIASARNVSTDWVVTMPGQYAMLDQVVWLSQGLSDANCGTSTTGPSGTVLIPECNFRDIPVSAALTLYDREEGVIVPEDGDLVISPAPPGTVNRLSFPNEVNVVEWTDGSNTPVLGSAVSTSVDASVLGDFGWAELAVSSASRVTTGQLVCQFNPLDELDPVSGAFTTAGVRPVACNQDVTGTPVPVVGFVAWERSFPENPDGNYGRLIDHSFSSQ